MTVRARICALALPWEGTPYHKLGCVPGVGADCSSLLWTCYGTLTGNAPWQPYGAAPKACAALLSAQWEYHTQREVLLEAIRRYMPRLTEIPHTAAVPGDFLLLGFPGCPASHAALLLPGEMVLHPVRTGHGTVLQRERRHAALRKTERTAFSFEASHV